MATQKKLRQRKTMEIKRILGLDIAVARKVARHILDWKGYSGDIQEILTAALGVPQYNPGCECCGDSSYTWTGKKGYIIAKYGQFSVEQIRA